MYGHRLQGNIQILEGTELQTKIAGNGQRVLQSGANIHQKAIGAHPTRRTRKSLCEHGRNGRQKRQVSPDLQPSDGSQN